MYNILFILSLASLTLADICDETHPGKLPRTRLVDETPDEDTVCNRKSACLCCFDLKIKELSIYCAGKNLTEPPVLISPTEYHSNFSSHIQTIYVDLSMNSLESVPNMRTNGYQFVQSLDLAGNRIRHLTENLISPNLKAVYLEKNCIAHIDVIILIEILTKSPITNITLQDNPWKCDEEPTDLIDILQDNTKDVFEAEPPKVSNFTCHSTTTNRKREEQCSYRLYFFMTIIAFVCFLLIFIGFIIYKTRCICTKENINSDIKFTTFRNMS